MLGIANCENLSFSELAATFYVHLRYVEYTPPSAARYPPCPTQISAFQTDEAVQPCDKPCLETS